jgi:Flp pilus assembly protein TadG
MSHTNTLRRRRLGGHAVVELALFSPWIFFLFIGALDWGFYSYGLITLESAARVAAEYTSASSATAGSAAGACTAALQVMSKLPNVGSSETTCTATDPVYVTATAGTGPDGGSDSVVTVRYNWLTMIPIPGLLAKQASTTRSVTMRLRS